MTDGVVLVPVAVTAVPKGVVWCASVYEMAPAPKSKSTPLPVTVTTISCVPVSGSDQIVCRDVVLAVVCRPAWYGRQGNAIVCNTADGIAAVEVRRGDAQQAVAAGAGMGPGEWSGAVAGE